MKSETISRSVYKRNVILAVALTVILCVACARVILAQTLGSTQYIMGGIYPGAPSYTVWVDSGTYYAKDANGQTDYSGTNASQILQNAVDATSYGEIFIKAGTYSADTKIVFDNKAGVTISAEGIQTNWVYSGVDAAFQIGDETDPCYYINFKNIRISLSDANSIGINARGNTYYGVFDRVRVYGFGVAGSNVGIQFNAVATWLGYYTLFNPHITYCLIPLKLTGASDKTGVVCIGGYLSGKGPAVASGAGIYLEGVNTFQAHGVSITDIYYGIQGLDSSYGNSFIGTRMETVNTGVNLTTGCGRNLFERMSLSDYTTWATYNVSDRNLFHLWYGDKYTEYGSNATITGAVNDVVVAHGLYAMPSASFPQVTARQSGQGKFWVSAKTATTFTISFDTQPAGNTWVFDWWAEV